MALLLNIWSKWQQHQSSGDLSAMQNFGPHLRSIDQNLHFNTIFTDDLQAHPSLSSTKFESSGSHRVMQRTGRSLIFLKGVWDVKTISVLILRLHFLLHSISHMSVQGSFPEASWPRRMESLWWVLKRVLVCSCVLKFCLNLRYDKYN